MASSVGSSTSNVTALLQQKVREKPAQQLDPSEIFKTMDTDGDSSLSQTELTAALEGMQQGAGAPPPPPTGAQPPSAEDMFANIDTDSDGQITLEELQMDIEKHKPEGPAGSNGAPDVSELFSKLDGDSDGRIGETEFTKLLETMDRSRQQSFGTTYTSSAGTSAKTTGTLLGIA